ncbi:hypothetical protein DPMN_103357 [Dreissena polymorpha]|uniref:Uncharacterized protein n=1 Tax=Dreissena polymorpha TaxID=45954 RepID=A0A9D4JZ40_DREPO|nr:hypothetical protein DPMN_103357 [Dreissena polymorpha]
MRNFVLMPYAASVPPDKPQTQELRCPLIRPRDFVRHYRGQCSSLLDWETVQASLALCRPHMT